MNKLILLALAMILAIPLAFAQGADPLSALNGADMTWVAVAGALVMLMTPAVGFVKRLNSWHLPPVQDMVAYGAKIH